MPSGLANFHIRTRIPSVLPMQDFVTAFDQTFPNFLIFIKLHSPSIHHNIILVWKYCNFSSIYLSVVDLL